MKWNTRVGMASLVSLLLCGCSSPRWQMHQAEYSYRARDNPADEYSTQNTILLDTRTGKTWIMSPSDEGDVADYYWVEMGEKP